jgi:hypothetical protein
VRLPLPRLKTGIETEQLQLFAAGEVGQAVCLHAELQRAGDVFLRGFAFDAALPPELNARLWSVSNAPHHPQDDFALGADGLLRSRDEAAGLPRRTWASVGGKPWTGEWTTVGTAKRWAALQQPMPRR